MSQLWWQTNCVQENYSLLTWSLNCFWDKQSMRSTQPRRHGCLAVLLAGVGCYPKKSHPHLCSQTIDPWDTLINLTEILLEQVIGFPLLPFTVACGTVCSWEWRVDTAQSHSCFALTYIINLLMQLGRSGPCKDRSPFSEIISPLVTVSHCGSWASNPNHGCILFKTHTHGV